MNIPNKSISLDQLNDMFEKISENTDWNMKEPKLWGYFFTNDDPSLLAKAKEILVSKGYRFVDLYMSEKQNEKDPDLWWLHVEKEEIHTPKSLDKRNDEFYIFAHQMKLKSYDGYDVGPIK
ncbi:ribonuclease E inhibitor RraB [uncultured Desulfobacter sp.]|uniref:ribonuclease E inhibitor RraB n=1 Tax=uncultured Desulfobacter sp. TaxID=240139 RepID=UPI002AABE0AB|nr:ribonuclease E inhibitor RraB [uncultured Desulfobacter sp.]